MAGDVVDPFRPDVDGAAVAHAFEFLLAGNQHALFPNHQDRIGGLRDAVPFGVLTLLEAPGLAARRAQHDLAAVHRQVAGANRVTTASHGGWTRTANSSPTAVFDSVNPQIGLPVRSTSVQSPAICSAVFGAGPSPAGFWMNRMPSPTRGASKMPLSTSLNSSTDLPLASTRRRKSFSAWLQPTISRMNGKCRAQA